MSTDSQTHIALGHPVFCETPPACGNEARARNELGITLVMKFRSIRSAVVRVVGSRPPRPLTVGRPDVGNDSRVRCRVGAHHAWTGRVRVGARRLSVGGSPTSRPGSAFPRAQPAWRA